MFSKMQTQLEIVIHVKINFFYDSIVKIEHRKFKTFSHMCAKETRRQIERNFFSADEQDV